MIQNNLSDYAVSKLTELLIKTKFEENKTGKILYVKKTRAYQDLINLIRELYDEKH